MFNSDELGQIQGLILSDAVTVKGSQVMWVAGLAQRIGQERQGLMLAQRVPPMPSDPPSQ